MTNNKFDREMAGILKGMKVPYDELSWLKLEKRLKENDGDDAVFDKVIAGKLKAYSVPATGLSFEKLESKLDADTSFKRKSFQYNKLIGIAAAILLLISGFMLYNYDNTNNGSNEKSVATIDKSESTKQKTSLTDVDELQNPGIVNAKKLESNNKQNTLNEVVVSKNVQYNMNTNSPVQSLNTKYVGDNIFPHNPISNRVHNYGLSLAEISDRYAQNHFFNNYRQPNNQIYNFTLTIEFNNQLLTGKQNEYHYDISKNAFDNNRLNHTAIPNAEDGGSISNSDLTVVDTISSGFNSKTEVLPEANSIDKSDKGMFVKATIIPTVDFIETPNDIVLKEPGYSQVDNGIGAGLAISYKNNRHEVETGIDLMNLSYSPKKVVLENNKSSFFLDEIDFLKIRVPLVHKYHIYENDKWDFYSIAGISANAMLKSKYSFVEKSVDDNGKTHSLAHLAEELQDNFDFQKTFYYHKNYKKGLSDGTKLKDNFFVSANIGIGVRKKFKNGLSITFEPQYNYNFKSLGANNDMINSLEFKLGISKAINL